MTKTFTSYAVVGMAIAFVVLIAYALGTRVPLAFASAPSGLPATMATSSTVVVGPNIVTPTLAHATLFEASNCAARIITTLGTPISLSFAAFSSTTPSATVGHVQASSTTEVYDSGQFGCGLVSAYGFTSSTTITVSESR